MKKECQVIMLPTNDVNSSVVLFKRNETNKLSYVPQSYMFDAEKITQQHLYIVSDDDIKEGEYGVYNNGFNSPGFVVKAVRVSKGIIYREPNETWKDYGNKDGGITPLNKDIKKIIATTDSSLKINVFSHYSQDLMKVAVYKDILLPQIPQSFLIEYCKNPVDKVMVEYETKWYKNTDRNIPTKDDLIDTLKINLDNTINISIIKTSWSREEVIELLCNAISDANKSNNRNVSLNYQTWIEENLK